QEECYKTAGLTISIVSPAVASKLLFRWVFQDAVEDEAGKNTARFFGVDGFFELIPVGQRVNGPEDQPSHGLRIDGISDRFLSLRGGYEACQTIRQIATSFERIRFDFRVAPQPQQQCNRWLFFNQHPHSTDNERLNFIGRRSSSAFCGVHDFFESTQRLS